MSYPKEVEKLLTQLQQEKKTVATVAKLLKKTVDAGGVVYVFGSGHSSILVEEAFHRAGGLVPVYPVLHSFLSPHTTPRISGKLERVSGIAEILFERCAAKKGDLFWIVSNSGINAVPVEMALVCREAHITTVAVTSKKHSASTKSRHESGKKLYEVADHILDNHCPPGDALVDFKDASAGAGSTLANAFLWNWVLTEACALWDRDGKTPPVYRSANRPGGDEYNLKLEQKYKQRIPQL